jgi:hypothetical protein
MSNDFMKPLLLFILSLLAYIPKKFRTASRRNISERTQILNAVGISLLLVL